MIEIVLSVAMLAILAVSGYDVLRQSLQTAELARQFTLAELMAHDLIELTTSKRNEDWNSLAAGTFHFAEDPVEGFIFVPGTETVDQFTRSIVLEQGQRGGQGQLVASGGTPDPETYIIDATVTWEYGGQPREVSFQQVLTNWKNF